ncbi:MAG: response regulator [Ktedonobacterales bacterium]
MAISWVLVVDDDQGIRETLRQVLEDAGYHVIEAPDGAMALDVLRSSPHRLVALVDLMMPKLDGERLFALVAADPHLVTQHGYILSTASPNTLKLSFVNILMRLAAPVLHKPFDIDVVVETVAQVACRLEA